MSKLRSPKQFTIQDKLVLIIVCISTISVLLAASSFTLLQLREHKQSMLKSVTSEANITANNVQAAILFGDHNDANKVLSEFKNDSRVVTAAIYTHKKVLFSSYNPTPDSDIHFSELFSLENYYQFKDGQLYLYQPIRIEQGNSVIGYIYLQASQDAVYQQLKQNVLVIIFIVMSVLLVTVLITSRLQKIISSPILELSQTTETIKEEKDYAIRVEHDDYLEIQQLSDGFNAMLSEIQLRDEHLQRLAMYDELTDLHNRKYFIDVLQQAIAHGARKSQHHAILFLDLDRFKHINDSLGHSTGDEILKQTGKRLEFITREDDLVARFGGDEFVFLLQDIPSLHHVIDITERILERLRDPFIIDNHNIVITPSIGISLYPRDGQTPDDLLKKADTAMYRAKNKGGNHHLFFTDSMNVEAEKRLKLEEDLHAAIKNDEFILHYQPKVCLKTGEVAGMETLVRWQQHDNTFVAPNAFIPIAEETGLIIPIGKQIIYKAVQQAHKWAEDGLLKHNVAINISAKQFRQPNFLRDFKAVIENAQLSPEHIEIEITEAAVIEDTDEAINIMKQLKEFGVTLAIDDFGTGHSSLSYLKKFPIDTLKIDMSFIRDMLTSPTDLNIVKAIIDLAHTLDLTVVAEGVEHRSQAIQLQGMGCDYIQGYLFSKPLDVDNITGLLEKHTNLFDALDLSHSIVKSI